MTCLPHVLERSTATVCRRAADRAGWLLGGCGGPVGGLEAGLREPNSAFSLADLPQLPPLHLCSLPPAFAITSAVLTHQERPLTADMPSPHQFFTPSVLVCCHFPRESPSESQPIILLGSWPGPWVSPDRMLTATRMGCDGRWGPACLPQRGSQSGD